MVFPLIVLSINLRRLLLPRAINSSGPGCQSRNASRIAWCWARCSGVHWIVLHCLRFIDFLDIKEKLQDTLTMIAQVERQLAENPGTPSLLVNLKALHKRSAQLQAELEVASANIGVVRASPR